MRRRGVGGTEGPQKALKQRLELCFSLRRKWEPIREFWSEE